MVQTCVTHLIRASMKYVSYADRKKIAAALKPIYTAVNEAAAKTALDQLRAEYGKNYPGVIAAWDRAWEQFIPFLDFDRGHQEGDLHDQRDRVPQLPAPQDHQEPRPLPRPTTPPSSSSTSASAASRAGTSTATAPSLQGRVRGTGTLGWTRALNALAVRFGDRLPI